MFTRTQLVSLLIVGVLSSTTTLAVALLLFPIPSRAAPDPQTPVTTIRTQQLELVNAAGEVRARLLVHPTGGGALYLSEDANLAGGVEITATAGSGGIVLRDATGRVRTGLNAGGTPSIFLTDETGRMIWQAP
jgi:hypothetical protein